jgi:hypothetical protein
MQLLKNWRETALFTVAFILFWTVVELISLARDIRKDYWDCVAEQQGEHSPLEKQ